MATTQSPPVKPTIAIVGRPNVGKSTLFNRLTRSRDALVAAQPGVTRDAKVGLGRVGEAGYIVIDTGGIDEVHEDELSAAVAQRALDSARSCDTTVLVVDAQAGMNAADEQIAALLRRKGVTTVLAVNKSEGKDPDVAPAEFAALGLAHVYAISATQGHGVEAMMQELGEHWPRRDELRDDEAGARIRVAVVGRPNVGKSTLVNRILGEERMITCDRPGTTRDSVDFDFDRHGSQYTIIDTAGLRRKSRVRETVEKYSAIQALQAIDRAQVVLLLIDAHDGVTEQDANLLGLVIDSGRALVIAVNKWDGLSDDQRRFIKSELDRRLTFVEFAELRFISGLHGTGVGDLFGAIDAAWRSAFIAPKANELTELLLSALEAHPPPLVRGRRIKLRYAHLGGKNPPRIVVHGNQVKAVPRTYVRYLENAFRRALGLIGTPVRLELRQGDNPFSARRNKLSKRQLAKRKRLLRHVKQR